MSKDYSSLEPLTEQPEFCTSLFYYEHRKGVRVLVQATEPCGVEIKAMAFKGTGFCGEDHYQATDAAVNKGKTTVPEEFAF